MFGFFRTPRGPDGWGGGSSEESEGWDLVRMGRACSKVSKGEGGWEHRHLVWKVIFRGATLVYPVIMGVLDGTSGTSADVPDVGLKRSSVSF